MRVLLDTNILLSLVPAEGQLRPPIERTMQRLRDEGARFCICAQNIIEFWVTATRPAAANGWDLPPARVRQSIDGLLATFDLLPDPPDLLRRWLDLCTKHGVVGRKSFDTRLVALMNAHAVEQLLTLNRADFGRYEGLALIEPDA
ncbi:MAG: PIN domain-containing protein [Phycisphaerales bacterium]